MEEMNFSEEEIIKESPKEKAKRLKAEEERWEKEKRRRQRARNFSQKDLKTETQPSEEIQEKGEANLEIKNFFPSKIPKFSLSEEEEDITEIAKTESKIEDTEEENFITKIPKVVKSESEDGNTSAHEGEELTDTSDIETENLSIEEQLERERMKFQEVMSKMKQLTTHYESYKNSLEERVSNLEEELERGQSIIDSLEKEKEDLLIQLDEVNADNQTLKEHLDEVTEDYEDKLKAMKEEKRMSAKENIENLQTLIKELNYIEEVNTSLTSQLEQQEKYQNELKVQISLQSELIVELEKKLNQKNESTSGGEFLNTSNQDLLDQKKREKLGDLLTQIHLLVAPSLKLKDNLVLLQEEREAHQKTKELLEEKQKKIEELKIHNERQDKIGLIKHKTDVVSANHPSQNSETSYKPAFLQYQPSMKTDLTNDEKVKLLFRYIEEQEFSSFQKLIKANKFLVNSVDENGRTALHRTVAKGLAPFVKFLIENDADINAQDKFEWTVLHCATKCETDPKEVLRILLKNHNLKVNIPNSDKNLPLHYFVESPFFNKLYLKQMLGLTSLCDQTLVINYQNKFGESPLHRTCLKKDREIAAEALINYGANTNLTNDRGETPLHYAVWQELVPMVNLLLEKGADPTIRGTSGTPIDICKNPEINEILVRKKNFINARLALRTTSLSTPTNDELKISRLSSGPGLFVTIRTDLTEAPHGERINPNMEVKDALQFIRQKFPFHTDNYALFIGGVQLKEDKKLSDYPITQFKEIHFKPKPSEELLQISEPLKVEHSTNLSSIKITPSESLSRSSSFINNRPRDTSLSVSATPSFIIFPDNGEKQSPSQTLSPIPDKWEKEVDRDGNNYYINRHSCIVTRKDPTKPINLSKTPTFDFSSVDEKTLKKIILAQSCLRRGLCIKRYKDLVIFKQYRKQILNEIFKNEDIYFKTLTQIFLEYVKPIVENKCIPKKILGDSEQLFLSVHSLLEMSAIIVDQSQIYKENPNALLGETWLKIIPSFQYYTQYTTLYYDSLPTLQDKSFSLTIEKATSGKLTAAVVSSLPQWLFNPISHIDRFKKLLQELLRYTFPNYKDYLALKSAVLNVQKVVNEVQSIRKQSKNFEEINRIQKKLTGNVPNLKTRGRFFIREGELVKGKDKKKKQIYLFSDCIVLAEKGTRGSGITKFQELLNLTDDMIVSEFTERGTKLFPFKITSMKDAKFSTVLYASSEDERGSWVRVLKSIISDLKDSNLSVVEKRDSRSNSVTSNSSSGSSGSANSDYLSIKKSDSQVPLDVKKQRFKGKSRWSISNLDFSHKEVCSECSSTLGLTLRQRYRQCSKCGNLVCGSRNCSSKIDGKRVCKTCQQNSTITLLSLSDKILLKICSFIPVLELPLLFLTCKKFYELQSNYQFWNTIYTTHWKLTKDIKLENTKKAWMEKCIAESNWDNSKYSVRILKGHTSSISTLKMLGNTLVSGSVDTTIKIWNLNSKQCISTLKGHTGTVRCLDFDLQKKRIVSSHDGSIKLWDLETGQLISTHNIHSEEITAFQYDSERGHIISGGADKLIKVTDMNEMKIIKTISGHKSKISCLQVRNDILVTGCKNDIKLWDLTQGKCVNSLKGHTDFVRTIWFDNSMIASGSDDETIFIHTEQGQNLLRGHKGKINTLQFNKNRLVSGSTDSTIKLWNLSGKFECYSTLTYKNPETEEEGGWVKCLQFDENGLLVSGHGDSLIRLWNFN